MKPIVSAMSVILALCTLDGAWAGTWYVDASVPKAGDGTSWEKAFKKIQSGIDKAAEGDTVIVAQGTYVENIRFKGKSIILTSSDPVNWNVVAKTVIDGNKAGSVVQFAGTEDETCVLSGFTIRNGTGVLAPGETGLVLHGGGIMGAEPPWATATPTRATIENSIISGNSADNGGGLCVCHGMIRNNIIIGNWSLNRSSDHCGGGIGFCGGTIENNLIVGNSANCGGAISFSNVLFRNNVVVGNTASLPGEALHGGGLAHVGTSSDPASGPPGGSITNCIIWANTAPTGPQVHESLVPTYCCIQDWTGGGEGNIALNPAFVDPDGPDDDPNTYEDNDYRLLLTSPCIDAGINEDWMNGATDLDGRPRILVGATSLTVDMGAYELKFPLALLREPATEVELSWIMRPLKSYTVFSTSDVLLQPWSEETTILGGKTGGPAVWVDASAFSALKFYKIAIE